MSTHPTACDVCERAPPAVAFPVLVEDPDDPDEWICRECRRSRE